MREHIEVFRVELELTEAVNDDQLDAMSEQIAMAVKMHCENFGIVAEDSNSLITMVRVRSDNNRSFIEHVYENG